MRNTLPEFEFRIPDSGEQIDSVDGHDVRCWVGFVRTAAWPQDQAGVGVYAHGKIAQDRPFTFGVRGKEIFTRYMFGVVQADWLDELAGDVISTDRTSGELGSPGIGGPVSLGRAAREVLGERVREMARGAGEGG